MSYDNTGATLSGTIQCFLYYLCVCMCGNSMKSGACCTFSLSVSRAEVASSNNSIFGSLTRARAIATRCFCPPDN